MIRGVIEELLRDHAWWLVGPFAGFLAALAGPSSELFQQASSGSVSWRSPEGLLGMTAMMFFLGVSLITAATIVKLVGFLIEIPIQKTVGLQLTNTLRYLIGGGLVLLAWVTVDAFDPVATGARLKDDIHTIFQILGGSTGIDVNLDAMLWGVTNNPLVEFVGLVTLVIVVGTFVVHRYTYIPTLWVATGSVMISLAMVAVSAATGTEVFPMKIRWAFIFTIMVLWGLMIGLIIGIDRFIYELQASTPLIDEGTKPRTRYVAFDAFVMIVLFGVMGSPLSGFIGWAAWRLWRIGGWQSLKNKYNSPHEEDVSRAPEPEPNPVEVEIDEQD